MVITINRPEARNAVNAAVSLGVGEAMEDAGKDPEVWAVILTGAGDKAFCAGADLKAMPNRAAMAPPDPRQAAWGFAGFVRHHISKPTIAAVNGFALGGGTEIVLAADLAVATENATFGLPEVKRGILAAAGGAFRLQTQIPRKIAMEMLLTGDPITARRALELGLVNAVAPQGDLMEAAFKLAARITVNAPLSVQTSKRIARGIVDGEIPAEVESWTRTADEGMTLRRSEDSREGPLAFAQKRPPVWKGR
jgi:crotonobetainyl-CoA hydratase